MPILSIYLVLLYTFTKNEYVKGDRRKLLKNMPVILHLFGLEALYQ